MPPPVEIPHDYNAAVDLLERNLLAGRADKVAFIDDHGTYTYGELNERVNCCANALVDLGLHIEQRVMLRMQDSIDFPVAFLGCIKAGLVPVAVNTLLTSADYAYMLHDSRAFALVVSEALLPAFSTLLPNAPFLKHVIVAGGHAPCDALRSELQQHVKKHLAPYKYPRWIEFATELPKTATGKIQRFKLRQDSAAG